MSQHTNRFAHVEPEHNPRCLARARVLQPLFRSPMTGRDLNANRDDDEEESRGGASDAVSACQPTPSEPMRPPAASSTRAAGPRRRAQVAPDKPPPFRVTMVGERREPDPYGVLGVARDAPDREIRRAYRHLARQQHPDLNPRPDGPERFAALTRAYELLSDPAARARYDARTSRAAGACPSVTREASRAAAMTAEALVSRATLELSPEEAWHLARWPLRLSDRAGYAITLPAGTADGDQITLRYRGRVVLSVRVRAKT